MERMIKRIAIRKDGTISMSEFRNFAEKYQGEIDKLEEENKNLTKCNLNLQEWLDNKEKVNKSLREENKKLEEELDKYKKQYEHSMGFSDFGGYDLDNNK